MGVEESYQVVGYGDYFEEVVEEGYYNREADMSIELSNGNGKEFLTPKVEALKSKELLAHSRFLANTNSA